VRNLEAVVQDGFQVLRLAFEHVEPAAKPRPGVECAASRGDLGHHLRTPKVVIGQRLSVHVAQQQDAKVRAIVDHRRADARSLGSDGIVVLLVAVDGQEIAGGVDAAGDIDRVRGGHLDVAIRQPARQFLQLPRSPCHRRNLFQQRIKLRVGQRKRHRFTVTLTPLKV
jgi:hypothetical protein